MDEMVSSTVCVVAIVREYCDTLWLRFSRSPKAHTSHKCSAKNILRDSLRFVKIRALLR
jgi:hypothetical protein